MQTRTTHRDFESVRRWLFHVSSILAIATIGLGFDAVHAQDPAEFPTVSMSGGSVEGVWTDGSVLYLATGRQLEVYDVSDPVRPVRRARLPLSLALGREMVVDGARLFILGPQTLGDIGKARRDGVHPGAYFALLEFDVSEPFDPVEIGRYPVAHAIGDRPVLFVSGYYFTTMRLLVDPERVYAVMGTTATVFLRDQMHAPHAYPLLFPGDSVRDASLRGDQLWVVNAFDEVRVFDTKSPWTDRMLDSARLAERTMAGQVVGDFFLAAGSYGMEVFDARGSNRGPVEKIATVSTPARQLRVVGDDEVLLESPLFEDTVTLVELLDTGQVQVHQQVAEAKFPAAVLESHILSSDGAGNLSIYQRNPASAQSTAQLTGLGIVFQVLLDGHTAYLDRGDAGVLVVDIEDGRFTDVRGVIEMPRDLRVAAIAKAGGRIWMATGPRVGIETESEHGLHLIEEDAAGAPIAKRVELPGDSETSIYDLQSVGGDDRLLVTTADQGVWVLHVAGGDIRRIGTIPFERAGQISRYGDYYYLAARGGRTLSIFDLAEPSEPRLVGEIPGRYLAVAITGERLIAANDTRGGGVIYDLSDPIRPRLLDGEFPTAFPIEFLSVTSEHGVLALDLEGKLYEADISVPGRPRVTAATHQHSSSLAFDERYIYLANHYMGISVLARNLSWRPTPTPSPTPSPTAIPSSLYLPLVSHP